MMTIRLSAHSILLATALATARVACAEEARSLEPEILVTAQRRTEPAQTTPIAITALGGDFIEHTKLQDVKDLVTFTPGFSGNSDDSFIDALAIRGIVSNDYGIGGDPSIGIFKDGVYQGRTGSVVTALYDIERTEALRGPQGFLFGRNAISGAISVITAKPKLDEIEGDLRLGYGDTDRKEIEAAFNLPVAPGWALRLAGFHTSYDGWIDNAFTPGNDRLLGGRNHAARLSLLHSAGPVRLTLIGEYEKRRLDGTLYRAANADREVLDHLNASLDTELVVRGGPHDIDSDLVDPRDDSEIGSLTLEAALETDFATLTSISAYRTHRYFYAEDYDGTPLLLGNYTQRQRGSYASQELRLASPDKGAVTWSTGLSFYHERVRARFTNETDETAVCRAGFGYDSCDALTQDLYGTAYGPAGVLVDINEARSTNSGLSVFGDGNVHLSSKLVAGAGLRYAWDRKRFALSVLPSDSSLGNIWTFPFFTDGFVKATRHWGGFTPRLYTRYDASTDLSVYVSVTRGYKAGGFGTFTVDAPSPIADNAQAPAGTRPDAFAPETVWSKELGIKGAAFDRRLRFDLTGFHYVYDNLQTTYFNPLTRTQEVVNVGKVHGFGVEAGATLRPNRWFDIYGTLTWTRTRKTGDRDCLLNDCGGLPNPTWASSGVATVRQPIAAGEAYLQGEWNYQGRRRESFDWRGITRRSAYTEINLRFGYRSGSGWEANLYVQNLLDSRHYAGAENGGDLIPANQWGPSQPRNIGVDLRWHFS